MVEAIFVSRLAISIISNLQVCLNRFLKVCVLIPHDYLIIAYNKARKRICNELIVINL